MALPGWWACVALLALVQTASLRYQHNSIVKQAAQQELQLSSGRAKQSRRRCRVRHPQTSAAAVHVSVALRCGRAPRPHQCQVEGQNYSRTLHRCSSPGGAASAAMAGAMLAMRCHRASRVGTTTPSSALCVSGGAAASAFSIRCAVSCTCHEGIKDASDTKAWYEHLIA
jgi:hypothetical protein